MAMCDHLSVIWVDTRWLRVTNYLLCFIPIGLFRRCLHLEAAPSLNQNINFRIFIPFVWTISSELLWVPNLVTTMVWM